MFANPSAVTMQVGGGSPVAFSQKRLQDFRSRSLGILLPVLLALVIGIGLGMGFWSAVASHPGASSASPMSTPQHTATAAPSTPGPASTPGNGHHGSHKKHDNGDGSDSGN